MTKPPIRHVVLATLLVAIASQVGLGAILSQPADDRVDSRTADTRVERTVERAPASATGSLVPAGSWAENPLSDDVSVGSVEQALVRLLQDLDGTWLLAVAGTARRDDGDVLDNDVREAIYDTLQEETVVRLTRLTETVGVSTSTARYHVRILESAEMVDVETIWGKRWLSVPATDPTERHLAAALDDEALASLLASLLEREPASVSELATTLDRAPSTVSHHLQRLADVDLVERERDGSSVLTATACGVRGRLQEEL